MDVLFVLALTATVAAGGDVSVGFLSPITGPGQSQQLRQHIILPVHVPTATRWVMVADAENRPVRCATQSSMAGFWVESTWQCGDYTGSMAFIHTSHCLYGHLLENFHIVLDIPNSAAVSPGAVCSVGTLGTGTALHGPHTALTARHRIPTALITRAGKEFVLPPIRFRLTTIAQAHPNDAKLAVGISLALGGRLTHPPPQSLDDTIMQLLAAANSTSHPATPTSDEDRSRACGWLTQLPHLFLSRRETVLELLHSCGSALRVHDLPNVSPSLAPHDVLVPPTTHVELLETEMHVHMVTTSQQLAFNARQHTPLAAVTKADLSNTLRHMQSLEASRRRAGTWIEEVKSRNRRDAIAQAVGHKLCVHDLVQAAEKGDLTLRRDINLAAGSNLQAEVVESVMEQIQLKGGGKVVKIVTGAITSIVLAIITPVFKMAFAPFFNTLLPLLCYFLLLLLLQILFKYGINQLGPSVADPANTILLMFMSWPVVLTVSLTIYHRIGLYIYRNVRRYIFEESVPQIADPASHMLGHTLTHSVTTSLTHTLTQSLTHTLSHSLSNSVFHFYRCAYCYHYGDQCDYCFYDRDYQWQWRMAWSGNSELRAPGGG